MRIKERRYAYKHPNFSPFHLESYKIPNQSRRRDNMKKFMLIAFAVMLGASAFIARPAPTDDITPPTLPEGMAPVPDGG